jgi:5-methyltetrahydrofolate--homocysteine methyltransferase
MPDRKYTNRRFLDALAQKVLVFDGAMGTNLQDLQLSVEDFGGEQTNGCNDFLVISHPQAVEGIHRSFLEAGVDVIETDTFRANRITLQDYGLQERVREINEAAARLSRRIADEFSNRTGQQRFVAGSMGPTGRLPSANDPELSNIGFDELADVFREQAAALAGGGADLVLIETSQDILEMKAAIAGALKAFEETGIHLPIQAQVTLDTSGRMLLGTNIEAALAILEGLPIDVIGLNCSTGPEHMREPIRLLGEQATLPVSCIPNAGLPLNVDGQAVYPLQPEPFAEALLEFVEKHHISIVGGCCGTTPEHLRLLVKKIASRSIPPRPKQVIPRLASAILPVAMQQVPPPLLIGERCNAQGSRKFKQLLLAEDYDAILEIARQQVQGGAHALDVSCAVTERPDEIELMRRTVKKLELGVEVPLVIDTTEVDVLEAALKTAPGRCLINSTNLESGRAKADRVLALARAHNAAVILLTIDENGMAKKAEAKLAVARRLYEMAVNDHGLRPDALVFDALTFTLATGDSEFADSAKETIEGIRLIKQALPEVFASLGISNLSFGLPPQARPPLNSVMLYHCLQAGLDMAIINPTHVMPYDDISLQEKQLCEDLIFNRHAQALQDFLAHYANVPAQPTGSTVIDPTSGMTAGERLHWRVLHRHKEGVEGDIDEIIFGGEASARHGTAVSILNTTLLPAMKEVGDKFGAGELILPFVLQSAEVMKKAVTHLERYLDKVEGLAKGVVVLATVYGDVHDIGKNLVKTILANNGYTVIDLGKQVPAETIISRAVEVNATAIGLSALLVSTSRQMPLVVNELHRRGLKFPVLIGGAAINRRFGRRILVTDDGNQYEPGVFYCKDAFEGLHTMDRLINPEQRVELLDQMRKESDFEAERASKSQPDSAPGRLRSIVEPSPLKLPSNVKTGVRVVSEIPLEMVLQHLNINELYRLSWGAKNAHGEDWETLKQQFDSRLEHMSREVLKEGWLKPQAVYGLFPCQAEGDDLLVFDPQSPDRKLMERFTFPRQQGEDHLALSDYFVGADYGQLDLVAFQVVTVGMEATRKVDRLQEAGDYGEAYYTHGLAVQTAEATAEYLHRHIRRELGIPEGQGKRYSWGYPAIPRLEDHRKVFNLLPVEKELGMQLSPAFQLIPEQSTAAIIVPHKAARYFNVL